MTVPIARRKFVVALAGAAVAWPLAARAQQGDRVRRIGVLTPGDENDPVRKTEVSTFTQALADLGWADGRNVRMDVRWAGPDINRIRALVQELVGLPPYRVDSRSHIARRSYRRRPEITHPPSIRYLPFLETAACSPTEST